jgi:hypothetical protein
MIELSNLTFGVSVIPAATSLLREASEALTPSLPTSLLYCISGESSGAGAGGPWKFGGRITG